MNFEDLNDEIGADDWLIPQREITRRKLIKQTSRFKIYKADWFGDVLVYEPIRERLAARRHSQRACRAQVEASPRATSDTCLDQEAFSAKLNELCLGLQSSGLVSSDDHCEPSCGRSGADSAYSSLASTPQYNSSSSGREFQFPALATPQQQQQQQQQEMGPPPVARGGLSHKSTGSLPANSPPVVLNRDSFTFGCSGSCGTTRENGHAMEDQATTAMQSPAAAATSSGWFELNELRLVAHENFMLFMGASLSEQEVRTMNANMEHDASLVMQMSHPKSISLRDLLHANNGHQQYSSHSGASSSSSPRDRFFAAHPRPCQARAQRQLTVEAKLNICQQVTDAMTYLHDKNIVHGRLSSVNIYIELNQRVKISLLDSEEQQIVATGHQQHQHQRQVNLPALTYLSPELVRSLRVENCDNDNHQQQQQQQQQSVDVHMDTRLITRAADVFAFGTLLFELFEERFPFAAQQTASPRSPLSSPTVFASPEARQAANARLFDTLCLEHSPRLRAYSPNRAVVAARQMFSPSPPSLLPVMPGGGHNIKASASRLIYEIGSGQISARNPRTAAPAVCPALIDHVIGACWAAGASSRPSFKQLKFE